MTRVCGGGQLPFLTDEDRASESFCCYGEVEYGPDGCTCWETVFDLEQAPPQLLNTEPVERRTRCHDCAFRPDSPERARGDELDTLPNFFCHQGVRRPVAFRHPDGRVREVHDSADYRPLFAGTIGYKADGTPMELCAGWAQAQRVLAR